MTLQIYKNTKKTFHSAIQLYDDEAVIYHGYSKDIYPISEVFNNQKDVKDVVPATTEDVTDHLPVETESYLTFLSQIYIIPNITRGYQTMVLDGYQCDTLAPEMREMLEKLRHTMIHLKFFDCEFDLMALFDILSIFPLLETLEISMKLTMDETIELNADILPKLLYLRDIKIEVNTVMIEDILKLTTKTSILEFLKMLNETFNINEFNDYLKNYKSLTSISLKKY